MTYQVTRVDATRIQLRAYLQEGGPRKGNAMQFFGIDQNKVEITGVSNPRAADKEPINTIDPANVGGWQVSGYTLQPPGLPKATIKIAESTTGIPYAEKMGGCPFNLYETHNGCGDDVTDHLKGWNDSYVRIYSEASIGNADLGDRTTMMADGSLGTSFSLTLGKMYSKGSLNISQPTIATLSDKVVRDVTYAPRQVCADCGTPNDGTRLRYACTNAPTTSPGGKPYVLYTRDYGATWTAVQVTSAAAAEDLVCIRILGNKLIVLSKTGGGSDTSAMHYATLNASTGVPGTWTKVTTGFVSAAPANDMLVISPTAMLLCADGGYIYKCENVTEGVTTLASGLDSGADLARIKGNGEHIVAVGGTGTGTIVRSVDRGAHWAELTTYPATAVFTAVEVMAKKTIWAASSNDLYVTYDAGESWEQITLNVGAGSIPDIQAVTDEVMYFIFNGTTASLYSSYNGGESWDNSAPLVEHFATYTELKRIATPIMGSTYSVLANDATLVGDFDGAGAGVILTGSGKYV